MNLSQIQVDPLVATWMDRVLFILVGLIVVWFVLKLVGYFIRRAYNLTPVGTATSKDVRPDFLKKDQGARDEMLRKAKAFDAPPNLNVGKAANAVGFVAAASGFLSFATAAFFAFGSIEGTDETWKKLSSPEKFVAMVQNHPAGFAIALVMVITGVLRLLPMIRGGKVATH